LHLDEFNDDDEKDATEGEIISIEANKAKKKKHQGAHRQHTMFVEGILGCGSGSVGCCCRSRCLENIYEDAFWVALRNV